MNYLVLGAGKMGQVACYDFLQQPTTTAVTAADNNPENLKTLRARFGDPRLTTVEFDAHDPEQVRKLMQSADACLGAVHYGFNVQFTEAAIETRTHFCDLGGNNAIVRRQLQLDDRARKAGVSIIPDCGLAPGMVSVLVAWGVERWPWADTVQIRVGGLPQHPQQPLKYSLIFSVEGLINEYVEPVSILRDGKIVTVEPLTEIESLSFSPPYEDVEAFYTSGGTSTLPDSYAGRLKNLDYKTIRYPGHGAIIAAMYRLGLFSSEKVTTPSGKVIPRELTARLLVDHLPHDQKDVTLVRVAFSGAGNDRKRARQLTIVDQCDEHRSISSMARMTSYPAAIVAQMQADGRVSRTGVFGQELGVPPERFIAELRRRDIRIVGLEQGDS